MTAVDNARAAQQRLKVMIDRYPRDASPREVAAEEALRDLIAEHERLTAEGSCWDEAPSIVVPKGECTPMPARCELRSGHGGAHKSGRTEWMRRGPMSALPTDEQRMALVNVLADDQNYTYTGTHAVFEEGYGADAVIAAGWRPIQQVRGGDA